MVSYYYLILFILSVFLTVLYVYQWQKHFDTNLTAFFLLIPIVNLTFYLMYEIHDPSAAVIAIKIIYFGGCFLPWFIMMCMTDLCGIRVRRIFRIVLLLYSMAMYCLVLTVGNNDLFYKTLEPVVSGTSVTFHKEYGPLHGVFYICIALYIIADFIILIYTYRKKKQVSRKILILLFIPVIATMAGYFANGLLASKGYELVPAMYILGQIIYLLIVHRMTLYNVSEMVIESMVQSGDTGFITFDFNYNYLGSNATAKRILPALSEQTVDRPIAGDAELSGSVIRWLDAFKKDPNDSRQLFIISDPKSGNGDKFYAVNVSYLFDGRKRMGYQVFLEDDTANQKYIHLIDRYNSELRDEVAAKTERIEIMHDNLILGMAAMVEGRDNSTGGHIRRTSEGVRILVDEIRKDGSSALSDDFCRKLIKAAPMHDLGKIAVDDAILRKPGRFTPEEFEVMKTHAAKGAEIISGILSDTDDDEFRSIAENVAHYHHERYDGSGYPDGLKGGEIPKEARIMAIADVYDALVSKRVYKDSFSFPEADKIILEGMGHHFDPELERIYRKARPRLEAYYSSNASA